MVQCEVQDSGGNILGAAEPAERDLGRELSALLLAQGPRHVGVDEARRDHVAGDVARGDLAGQRLREDRVETWDADDFDPWETLRWKTVRVIRYRQHKPNGTVFEAYWLTDFPRQQVSSRALFRMAKSRWEVENQGFNEAKNLYGFEHICHHEPHSLLAVWLLTALALTIERLYRIRYLHRGTHPILPAITLWQLLWLSLSWPTPDDSS